MSEKKKLATKPGWLALLREHSRLHPLAALGLILALLVVFGLLAQSFTQLAGGKAAPGLRYALIGGMAAFGATALGALPAFALHHIPQKLEDSLLGFAAGMMLAASTFSLLIPGLTAGEEILGSKGAGVTVVVIGMALGVLLILGLDTFTPHKHNKIGAYGPGVERFGRIWLFIFAIILHNLPEGMAIGVAFSHADLSIGVPLTTAIALQDIPEGLAVAMAMRAGGFGTSRSVGVGVASGALEPLGALLGVALASGFAVAYPVSLGLAAGAMIFVVSHEVIPETHRNGHQTPATLGLIAGFALMMVLDTSLG